MRAAVEISSRSFSMASDEQRARWQRIGRGLSIHWPDVDEDLSVPHLRGLSD